ncbi:hypothetical protein ALC60_02060 [Trachymyrmex zeteki]|uniref:Uncharacterized protein n=1 Tax=Mycetomoellerius zeteki TaxID=64791 RepID=A0A151XET2_9HYME|nr:hypothetical protein ALC60_02060 [Trachymyrmex zeteki]
MLGDWGRSVSRRKLRTREESVFHHPFAHTIPLHLFKPSSTPPIGKPPRLRSIHVLPASIILTQPPIDRIQARRIAKYRRNVAEVVVDCVAYVSTPSARIATLRLPSAEDKSNGERKRNPTARGKDKMDSADDGGGQANEREELPSSTGAHALLYRRDARQEVTRRENGVYTPTVQRQHTTDTYGTSSVGEGLPRLGTRKTSFVEYPTGTAQPPSNSFNPLRKNQ